MNWLALWVATLFHREPPTVFYADDHERAAALTRQREQAARLELLLQREADLLRRRAHPPHEHAS